MRPPRGLGGLILLHLNYSTWMIIHWRYTRILLSEYVHICIWVNGFCLESPQDMKSVNIWSSQIMYWKTKWKNMSAKFGRFAVQMLWSSTVNIFAISDRPTLQMYKDIQILKSSKQARSQMQKRQAPTESKKIHTRQAKIPKLQVSDVR